MRNRSGYTLVEIMITLLIIGLLAVVAIPNYYHARTATRQAICVNNLRQINAAVDNWTVGNRIASGISVTSQQESEIYDYMRGGGPVCPSGADFYW